MTKVRAFSLSIDGFGAGPHQDRDHPIGVRGFAALFGWFAATDTFRKMHGAGAGAGEGGRGVDNDFALASFENVGAWILGRNMFSPLRGPDESWNGWWGEEPPYHVPVFVLTHYARPDLVMKGGTTFHFVTDGIEAALRRAEAAAGGKDVRIGGGVATVRQYLLAGKIDEMHLALSPALLGEGEHLFSGINLHALGFAVEKVVPGERATHLLLRKAVRPQAPAT